MGFIVKQKFGRMMYVCARPGWSRRADGTFYRDGTDPRHSGPEWHWERHRALRFASHRAAARIANTCSNAVIEAVA